LADFVIFNECPYLLFFGNNFIVDIITSTKALVPNYEGSPTSEFSLMDGLSRVA
jgi:hypothetical protein